MNKIKQIEHEYRHLIFSESDGYEIETEHQEWGLRVIVHKNGAKVFTGPIDNWLIFYKEVESE